MIRVGFFIKIVIFDRWLICGDDHLLALHPLQLVGAADTCRASTSATDGKRRAKREKKELENQKDQIKSLS